MNEARAIGRRIRELCKEKEISAADIALKCNEPERRVLRTMSGLLGCQGIIFLVKICKALDVSLDEFFDSDEMREAFK